MWVGGALQQLGPGRLAVKETSGTVVSVERLGAGATAFFRVSGGRWRQSTAPPSAGGMPVCVEAAVAGSRYLALRVFLGAPCGPD